MIKKIFDEIAAEGGSNKKMEILSKYKDNELLKRILYLANSKKIKWYIKAIPEYKMAEQFCQGSFETVDLTKALEMLGELSSRKKTGNEAINHLSNILSMLPTDDAYIIERIIDKDLKIGMGTSNINKVFDALIEKTPYMGARPYSIEAVKKLFEGGKKVFGQIKKDGRYSNSLIRSADVELESRQGEVTYLQGAKFLDELKQFDDCVLNGEFTIPGISRYISNGIIASLVSIGNKILKNEDIQKDLKKLKEKHGYEYQEALDAIHYTIWDKISVEEYFNAKSNVPYNKRLESLKKMIAESNCVCVELIEGRLLNSYEEAMEYFQEMLNRGEEGIIAKAFDGVWKNGKHPNQIKMKLEMDVDLKIVWFNYGTGKNISVISSVTAESSDGKVSTRPTGIDEDTMDYITTNQDKLMGAIIEVKSCGLSKDSNGNYSLLHPVYKSIRTDKDTADSLDDIIKIEAMAKGLV